MVRTIQALVGFKKQYEGLHDLTLEAYATAATRMAANQKEFLKRVKKAVGVDIKVIPGTKEAELDFLGVINTLPIQNALIMDTGGASTELILVQNRKLQHLISIPFGSVNLSERYLHGDTVSAAELFDVITSVNRTFNGIWWLKKAQNLPIVALGGSNRTLAKIQRRKDAVANFEDIHGYRMSTEQVNAIFKQVISSSLEERKAIGGLAKYRADIIVGGLVPVVMMIRFLDSDRLTFSQYGLREGALYQHLEAFNAGCRLA
jgi:exopolyphosphatase/guanosine-5'-triphosphate,3'-diphosphate pyrophosphatase